MFKFIRVQDRRILLHWFLVRSVTQRGAASASSVHLICKEMPDVAAKATQHPVRQDAIYFCGMCRYVT